MSRESSTFKKRIATMRWLLPLIFALMAIIYELSVARWIHDIYGDAVHFIVEILFFSTAGPFLAFLTLNQISRWLEEKELAESQARASDRRLASITSASADAIIGVDKRGKIESWNRGAELLFGYFAKDIQGRSFSSLFQAGTAVDVETSWLEEVALEEGFVRGHETVCLDFGGHRIDVEMTATSLRDDENNPIGMSIVLRDITNRKRREEEIRRLNASLNQQVADRTRELAEKLEELAQANSALQKLDEMRSEFVSLVSHQLRAPLTNMSGAVQRIKVDCSIINPTCNRMLQILEQQTLRLERLVQEVLNTARLEAGELILQLEPVSVLPVVQQIIDQVQARTDNHTIRLTEKPGLPMVFTDRDRMSEVLANLLDNAVKYSPPGSEVTIDVRADQTELSVSVRDCGPGVPEAELERIFDKYYRVDSSDSQIAYGYGLGLYVCRLLAEAQGGRVWAENHRDHGAVFSFSLPVWQGEHV